MILSTGPAAWTGSAPLAIAAAALLAYLAVALPPLARTAAWSAPAFLLAWLLHLLLLAMDIGGWGQSAPGTRLGFGPVLSATVWMVISVHGVESRLVPLPAVRRVLAAAGAAAVALAWLFPGETRLPASPWAPLHFVLGVACYGLFGAAVLHALLLDGAERRLRARSAGPGVPLLQLERMTFRFVEAGFAVLSATLLIGALTTSHWVWDHKTVFSLLGWAVFAALLAGRLRYGWRGRRATRWLYVGALLLLLAYVGSRFVLEVMLQRPVAAGTAQALPAALAERLA
jgi:ABC-type uncharacterized transport system permease subunit